MKSRNLFKHQAKASTLLKNHQNKAFSLVSPPPKKKLIITKNEVFYGSPQSTLNASSKESTAFRSSSSRRKTLSDFLLPNHNQKVANNMAPLSPQNLVPFFSEENIIPKVLEEDDENFDNPLTVRRRFLSPAYGSENMFNSTDRSNKNYNNTGYLRRPQARSMHYKGVVDFLDVPLKKNKRSYSVNDKYQKIKQDEKKKYIKKVTLIQSFVRMFLLRKFLYNYLSKIYKINAGAEHLHLYVEKLNNFYMKSGFYEIKIHKKRKYFLSKKEFELLQNLKTKKINNIKDLQKYFLWLSSEN